jgi:tetratricopeptide (TPR) repeat protein
MIRELNMKKMRLWGPLLVLFWASAAAWAGQDEAALIQKYKLLESDVLKAQKLLDQGSLEKCEAELARCFAAVPDHHAAFHVRAQRLYRQGDFEGALAAMESAKAGFRRLDEAAKTLRAAKLKEDLAAAQYLTDREPELEAKAAQTHCKEGVYGGDVIDNIGRINLKVEDVKKGLTMAGEASPAEYLYFTGNCQFKLRRYAEAEASFRAAWQASPDHAGAAGNLINLLYMQKRLDEARAVLARAEAAKIAIHPGLKKAVLEAAK